MTIAQPLALSAASVLEIWERGAAWHPLDQALLILQYAYPDGSAEDLSEWTLGRRDRRLLEIRRDIFGDRIEGYAECPACRNGLEFKLSCESMVAQGEARDPARKALTLNKVQWELREPNSRDLAAAALAPDLPTARAALLARCVRSENETDQAPGPWADAPEAALAEALAALDPLAEILIDLTCQACGHVWQNLFDIVTFLWSEIHTKARRVLQEIDVLARTYGWTQTEILGLSDTRRGWYVQMALS